MSQIASFYLLKDGQRQELFDGDCSGAVYMAIWDSVSYTHLVSLRGVPGRSLPVHSL